MDLFQTTVPSADVNVISCEVVSELLKLLEPELQEIVKMRLGRYSIGFIAFHMRLSRRSIDRRLAKVREVWISSGLLDKDGVR